MDFRIKSSLIIRGEDGAGGAQHHHGGQLPHIKHDLQLPVDTHAHVHTANEFKQQAIFTLE